MAKPKYIGCSVRELPEEHQVAAAGTAIQVNPANRPEGVFAPGFLALLTSKYWQAGGVSLSVSFLDQTSAELRAKILAHMNAWSDFCNASFVWTLNGGQVRISRGNSGYWSYLGTDVLHIPDGQATMNLQGFTLNTPESEYRRVVRHETGHTLGFPHEHARRAIVARLDPKKTVAYFQQSQGWSAQQTQQQVLTPLEDSMIVATPLADDVSIMCYGLPASITVDGRAIPGGIDIDDSDRTFAAKMYPPQIAPPPPPPPAGLSITLPANVPAGTYTLARQ